MFGFHINSIIIVNKLNECLLEKIYEIFMLKLSSSKHIPIKEKNRMYYSCYHILYCTVNYEIQTLSENRDI